MPMEFVFIIGMAVLLFLCLKVRANAFISLLATALVMGLLSGMTGADTIGAITGGFSGTVKSIGIIIIFGIMLGNYLDAAKGTNRMALDAVRLVGQKRAGLAMAITGYIVSIPVFSDAAFVILTPLVKAIHKRPGYPWQSWRSVFQQACWQPMCMFRQRQALWQRQGFLGLISGRQSCTGRLQRFS